MSDPVKGDVALVNTLGELAAEIDNYSRTFTSISERLKKSIFRFNAVIEPTSENKLKAYNIPPMEVVGSEIEDLAVRAKDQSNSIATSINMMANIIRTSIIKCPTCKEKGQVVRQSVIREGIQPIISMDRCPDCKGKGYLVISEDITRLAARLTEGLVKIT
mgnify:FL=1